jgi:protein-S-isoprenylcysteine O-methyltransferase Ste14
MIALKTLIFTIIGPGTVTVLVPYLILSSQSTPLAVTGSGLSCLGSVLVLLGASAYLGCAWSFTFVGQGTPAPVDPPKKMVAQGLYRFVRNPMYVGVGLVLLGESLLFRSVALFGYAVVVFVGCHLFVVFYEEPTLERKFGESYRSYLRSVPRWIPRMKRSVPGPA